MRPRARAGAARRPGSARRARRCSRRRRPGTRSASPMGSGRGTCRGRMARAAVDEVDAATARRSPSRSKGAPEVVPRLSGLAAARGLDVECRSTARDRTPSQLSGRWQRAAGEWTEFGLPVRDGAGARPDGRRGGAATAHDELHLLGARPAGGRARRLRELGARGVPRGARASTRGNAAGLTPASATCSALVAEGSATRRSRSGSSSRGGRSTTTCRRSCASWARVARRSGCRGRRLDSSKTGSRRGNVGISTDFGRLPRPSVLRVIRGGEVAWRPT